MATMQVEMRYYGFSLFALGAKAIIDLVRGSTGMPDDPWDVQRPVYRRRRRLFGAKPKRIPLSEFVEVASYKFGWQFHDGSCDILDLGNGLRQAAVDREVTIYGRTGCLHMPETYWDNYPLQPIPVEHLCQYWIDLAGAIRNENQETKTYAVSSKDQGGVVFADLWISREEGLRWLKGEGREWCGRSDARQGGPESMRQAIWDQLESAAPKPTSPSQVLALDDRLTGDERLALDGPLAPDDPLPLMIAR
jgi:hypothetical protein